MEYIIILIVGLLFLWITLATLSTIRESKRIIALLKKIGRTDKYTFTP